MTTENYTPPEIPDLPEPDPLPPITLTDDEEHDLYRLLSWAFMSRPGIPSTRVLGNLYKRLTRRAIDGADH